MLGYLPYEQQDISEANIQSVVDVLLSDWLKQLRAFNWRSNG